MEASPPYTEARVTAHASVEYFVRADFAGSDLANDRWAVSALEAAAESLKKEALRGKCDGQRREWQATVNAARRSPKGPERDVKVQQAEARPAPACAELETRFGEARSIADAFKTREPPFGGAAWRVAAAA